MNGVVNQLRSCERSCSRSAMHTSGLIEVLSCVVFSGLAESLPPDSWHTHVLPKDRHTLCAQIVDRCMDTNNLRLHDFVTQAYLCYSGMVVEGTFCFVQQLSSTQQNSCGRLKTHGTS